MPSSPLVVSHSRLFRQLLLEFLADEVPTGVVGDILRRSNIRVNLVGP